VKGDRKNIYSAGTTGGHVNLGGLGEKTQFPSLSRKVGGSIAKKRRRRKKKEKRNKNLLEEGGIRKPNNQIKKKRPGGYWKGREPR